MVSPGWVKPMDCLGEDVMEIWEGVRLHLPELSAFRRSFSAFSFSISDCEKET